MSQRGHRQPKLPRSAEYRGGLADLTYEIGYPSRLDWVSPKARLCSDVALTDYSIPAGFNEIAQTFTTGRTISPAGGKFIGTSMRADPAGKNVYFLRRPLPGLRYLFANGPRCEPRQRRRYAVFHWPRQWPTQLVEFGERFRSQKSHFTCSAATISVDGMSADLRLQRGFQPAGGRLVNPSSYSQRARIR